MSEAVDDSPGAKRRLRLALDWFNNAAQTTIECEMEGQKHDLKRGLVCLIE